MVLDRVNRKKEPARDLDIRVTAGDQLEDLELTCGQLETIEALPAALDPAKIGETGEKSTAKTWGNHLLTGQDAHDGMVHLAQRLFAKEAAASAGFQGFEHFAGLVRIPDDQNSVDQPTSQVSDQGADRRFFDIDR